MSVKAITLDVQITIVHPDDGWASHADVKAMVEEIEELLEERDMRERTGKIQFVDVELVDSEGKPEDGWGDLPPLAAI